MTTKSQICSVDWAPKAGDEGKVLTATGAGYAGWQTPSGGPGGFEFPVGYVVLNMSGTNPGTELGYGTWVNVGAGKVLIGVDAGDPDFDSPGRTGGAKTVASSAQTFAGTPSSAVVNHTHAVQVTDPTHNHTQNSHNHTQDAHSHLTQRYPTATGASSGFTIDTSMSGTLADNTLPTKAATATNQAATATNIAAATGITATTQNPAGGVASYTPAGTNTPGAATSVVQPFLTVYFWERTA